MRVNLILTLDPLVLMAIILKVLLLIVVSALKRDALLKVFEPITDLSKE